VNNGRKIATGFFILCLIGYEGEGCEEALRRKTQEETLRRKK